MRRLLYLCLGALLLAGCTSGTPVPSPSSGDDFTPTNKPGDSRPTAADGVLPKPRVLQLRCESPTPRLALSPDGKMLVLTATEEGFTMWDVATAAEVPPPLFYDLDLAGKLASHSAFTRDGATLCMAFKSKVTFIDSRSMQVKSTYPTRATQGPGFAVSPGGTYAATSTDVIEVASGKPVSGEPFGQFSCVTFGRDEKTLIGTDGNTLKIVDVPGGKVTKSFEFEKKSKESLVGGFCRVAASPTEDTFAVLVVTAVGKAEVQIRDLASGEVKKTFAVPVPLKDGALAWSPNGKWVAVGGLESGEPARTEAARLFDPATGQCVAKSEPMPIAIEDLTFSGDSKTLAAVAPVNLIGLTRVIHAWDLSSVK